MIGTRIRHDGGTIRADARMRNRHEDEETARG
jgi:hypothetical protein